MPNVSRARFAPTSGLKSGRQGRSVASAARLPVLVIVVISATVFLARPARADQISDLKAQATQVAQKLVQEQLQIGAYQQQYSVATAKVAADARSIAQVGQQIGHDQQRISREMDEVRQQAIVSYMEADTGLASPETLLFSSNVENASLANEYNAVAAGNADTAIDELRNSQKLLRSHQAALLQVQFQDQTDQRGRAADLDQAVSTEHQMEVVQSRVTGQLAQAVAAQAADQAAAAAAAVAAAQKAAAAKATVTATPTATAAPGAPASGTDPALNPFLQCVVQVESGGNYQDVSPNGLYMGAFQFSQPTWDMAAPAAGLPQLVGVRPNVASKAEQDTVAVALYALDGQQPWLGDRCSS